MKGGENMLKREVLYPSDMSEDGRRGDLTSLEAKSFDQEFKQQIRIKAAELIAQRNGVNYGPGADVLKEFVKSRFRYQLPYFFEVAKQLLKGEEPRGFKQWDWEDWWKKADYNVDAHTRRRWQSQRNTIFRNQPSLLIPLKLDLNLERKRLSYAEWEKKYIPDKTEGIDFKGFYQI